MLRRWNNLTNLYLPLLILSCSGITVRENGMLLKTKGLTCDAIAGAENQILICGETSTFSMHPESGQKDGYCLELSVGGNDGPLHQFHFENQSCRIEKIRPSKQNWAITGIRGDQKNKFVGLLNEQFEPLWVMTSDTLQTTDQVEMAANSAGELLLSCKHPGSDAYQMFIYQFDSQGQCQWARSISSVEILQDMLITKDQHYFISFKQKGAYIDGQTRKRYLMNSFYKLDGTGQVIWAAKFHMDDDQIHHAHFNKVIEDAAGSLYFIGIIAFQPNVENAYVVKTNVDGKIIWSKFYVGLEEVTLKSACFTKKGNVLLFGDGYGKKGGLTAMEINPNGESIWTRKFNSANYEQAIAVIEGKSAHWLVWDKLFTIGHFTLNQEGKSCMPSEIIQNVKPQEVLINMEKFKGRIEEIATGNWQKAKLEHTVQKNVKFDQLCN